MDQTFCKDERLSRKSLIKKLFDEGEKRFFYPFRITFLECDVPSKYPVQLLITVPRSLFKNATDRNRIKRLVREAYRQNKYILYDALSENHKQILLCLTYTSKEIISSQIIKEKIIVLLQRLKDDNAEVAQ
jgi:ribonuclease P protein component